jgi:hypothetical protein
MVDVPRSACLRSEGPRVCEARGAMSRRSRSRRRTAAHRNRCRFASRLLGQLLIPYGGRTGDAGSRLGRSMSMTRFAQGELEAKVEAESRLACLDGESRTGGIIEALPALWRSLTGFFDSNFFIFQLSDD